MLFSVLKCTWVVFSFMCRKLQWIYGDWCILLTISIVCLSTVNITAFNANTRVSRGGSAIVFDHIMAFSKLLLKLSFPDDVVHINEPKYSPYSQIFFTSFDHINFILLLSFYTSFVRLRLCFIEIRMNIHSKFMYAKN